MNEPERHVRPFRDGRNHALHISREFEPEGDEAIVRKGRQPALLAALDSIEEPFRTWTRISAGWTL